MDIVNPGVTQAAKPAGNNPLTGKKRTVSDGTELGDLAESFHTAVDRDSKYKILKASPELQRYFRLADYGPDNE